LVLAYILALAAGTTSGLLAERWRGTAPPVATTPLADQLGLSAAQVVQMREIWQKTDADSYLRRAQDIQRERDQALVGILTDDQKEKFAIMDQEFARRFDDLKEERNAVFRDALSKTEAMLSDEQRAKYEQIVRQRIGSFPSQQAAPATEPSANDLRP
jgi:hypothetical protein